MNNLEQRIKQLEQRVAALEEQVKAQPQRIIKNEKILLNIQKQRAKAMNAKLEQQEQLNKGELECIYRHLKMFVFTCWKKKENVPDACIGCNHYCNEGKKGLDPWPAFYKLSNLADKSYSGSEGAFK
ncbi:hypothetical protein ACJDU8_23045 [Clostridium sp. WILCCON 0269]|uniref:Uncharacterized protein n=1 Tax=Candidatus Clostridium eludens TaxID=3381663 RepID=A0ABW8SR55_9CLOT